MRKSTEHLYAQYELRNGDMLRVEWYTTFYPGDGWNTPDEHESSEPMVFIEGVEMHPDRLPKGMDQLVEDLYQSSGTRV